jgi:hypothetical protein
MSVHRRIPDAAPIPADACLAAQLCALERRTSRGGRDSIDHAPGAHDDLANAVTDWKELYGEMIAIDATCLLLDDKSLTELYREARGE